jgi:hypothetical protein
VAPQQQQQLHWSLSLCLSLSLLLVMYYYHVLSHPLALATSQVHCWILVLGVCCGGRRNRKSCLLLHAKHSKTILTCQIHNLLNPKP